MIRKSKAIWKGTLRHGQGRIELGSGAFEGEYSFKTRFEDEPGTNPEELIGAAHAACFSMALAASLTDAGHRPDEIKTEAKVKLSKGEDGFEISYIKLTTEAKIADMSEEEFEIFALRAKEDCPVSKALSATRIELEAKLVK